MIGVPREYSVQFSTIPSLRSKRFRAFTEQTARSKSQRSRDPPLSFFGPRSISRAAKTENPVPRSFFDPKTNGGYTISG